MECKFVIGQRVVLIDDNWDVRNLPCKYPQFGIIYTIDGIRLSEKNGEPCLTFQELHDIHKSGVKFAFIAKRFKPVDESKLDKFRKLINDVPDESELDAEMERELKEKELEKA